MPGISISGLGSSLDVEAIIAGLMKVEAAPRARLELRQSQAKAREEALREISSKLQTVADAATALRSSSLWDDVQTVQSSNPEGVSARVISGTGPGGYQVVVNQLARAEQRTFDFTPSGTPSQITINGVEVGLGAGATLKDAVGAINANSETGVFAVAVGSQLVLSSRRTGAANTIAASGAGIAEVAAKLKAGQDAAYEVDGVAAGSASNVVTDAVPGLELTLKAVTAAPATVTVGNPGPDGNAIQAKLKAFADNYNAALDTIRGRLTEERVPQPGSAADAKKGVLFGDGQLNSLLTRMRQFVDESGIGALGADTGAPGSAVSADSDAVVGHLALDPAKLAAALESDPAGAREAVAGKGGFSEGFAALLAPVLGTGGVISGRLDAVSGESRRISESMTALDARLEQREERLHLQFAALESALLRNQTQSAWLNGQLGQLS